MDIVCIIKCFYRKLQWKAKHWKRFLTDLGYQNHLDLLNENDID